MNPRKLKIEAIGDFAYRKVKPRIRLSGRWLEEAGFTPGKRVSVTHIAEGIIELRSEDFDGLKLYETGNPS
jgi:hypothetical protein